MKRSHAATPLWAPLLPDRRSAPRTAILATLILPAARVGPSPHHTPLRRTAPPSPLHGAPRPPAEPPPHLGAHRPPVLAPPPTSDTWPNAVPPHTLPRTTPGSPAWTRQLDVDNGWPRSSAPCPGRRHLSKAGACISAQRGGSLLVPLCAVNYCSVIPCMLYAQ